MHWDFHFGPEVDEDEDLLSEAGGDVTKTMRVLHREQMHDIWEKAKAFDLEDLDAEEIQKWCQRLTPSYIIPGIFTRIKKSQSFGIG